MLLSFLLETTFSLILDLKSILNILYSFLITNILMLGQFYQFTFSQINSFILV